MLLATLLALLTPLTTYAQDFVPLVGIPFVETGAPMSLKGYADALYIGAISLGAVIAVLKIIFAGVKYMLTDVVTDKSSAKADIKGALLGLVIMIGAVLLLNTINPQITEVTALNLQVVEVDIAPPAPRAPENATEYCDSLEEAGDTCYSTPCSRGAYESESAARQRCEASCDGAVFNVYGALLCYESTEERLASLLTEHCPEGETCEAEMCEGGVLYDCEAACDDEGEFHFDTVTDACIRLVDAEEQQFAALAERECPEGRTCRAEPCDTSGYFYNCATQCSERNGIHFEESLLACVFYNDSYDPVTIPITVNPGTQYFQRQNEDEIAAGDEPVSIEIVDVSSTGGFVTVEYPDGRQVELSCGYIVPNPCTAAAPTNN